MGSASRQCASSQLPRGEAVFSRQVHFSARTTPYSPDLPPCDFYLYPKLKSALKGTNLQSVDEVKSKTADLLNRVSGDDLQRCFDKWKIRMKRYIDGGRGVGWRGYKVICKSLKINPIFHTSLVVLQPHLMCSDFGAIINTFLKHKQWAIKWSFCSSISLEQRTAFDFTIWPILSEVLYM
jgi:hypothetical protein